MNKLFDTQGRLADTKLANQGLILTQGGEPTFVPHDTSAPEWNIAALGPDKLLHARKLARELATSLFDGGVVIQSFGKQYPNEPLPRWQVSIYRSRTGKPLWRNFDHLRLDQTEVTASDPDMPAKFIARLAQALDVDSNELPAYENLAAKLQTMSSEEAKRMLPRFSRRKRAFISTPLPDDMSETWQGYFEPAGWVLPLSHDDEKWITGKWELPEDDDLILIPGDSPVGLRLPLGELPEDALRSGLSVECKRDELIVFLPPLSSFAAFAELVRTIEDLVEELQLPPVRLEGYNPPGDDDAESIALTSDPGVLEVNLPPAADWPEYERVIRGLFDATESIGMRGYKFQMSGRKVSTGGGSHIILGGPNIEKNPFIARPDLLSSWLRFLQHHPAMSYAFSGMFIGPSSQAPRVDESAYELPYELGITLKALDEMERPGDPVMIDALLRNLLMDWNGNTHRAELSVDKFYPFANSKAQIGLIEFRAYEMVGEPDALLAPNLLLRALTACFAEKPFTPPLIDWREKLHDQFTMPHFLREDLHAIVRFLNEHGFAFPEDTFDGQLDFRFPVITDFEVEGSHWTLRHALELWPVMGEHEGTGRIVDSTTDRLELRVTDLPHDTPLVATVNGHALPLHRNEDGSAVAAIRYRLFNNVWGLQPHISAHSPLRIEVCSSTDHKILHAFEFLNWKRPGEGYDGLPDNAAEAAARVAERLLPRSDLIGSTATISESTNSERAPLTLDLRRL
ncbi:MAG: hypothetical protein SynsKO_44910 [Synoicihabitans sp.]